MNNKKVKQKKCKDTERLKSAFKRAYYELQKDPAVNFASWAKKNPDEFKRLRKSAE